MKSKSIVINALPYGFLRQFNSNGFNVFLHEHDLPPRFFQKCSSIFSAIQIADSLMSNYSSSWSLDSVSVMCCGVVVYNVSSVSDTPVCHV